MTEKRFCQYCWRLKPDEGFKFILNVKSASRSAQCPACQDLRKKPRVELEEMARKEVAAKARENSRLALQREERKRRNV